MKVYEIIADSICYFVQLFDKEVKSYVYVLDGTAEKSKMQLPKDMKQGCEYINTFECSLPCTNGFMPVLKLDAALEKFYTCIMH